MTANRTTGDLWREDFMHSCQRQPLNRISPTRKLRVAYRRLPLWTPQELCSPYPATAGKALRKSRPQTTPSPFLQIFLLFKQILQPVLRVQILLSANSLLAVAMV